MCSGVIEMCLCTFECFILQGLYFRHFLESISDLSSISAFEGHIDRMHKYQGPHTNFKISIVISSKLNKY